MGKMKDALVKVAKKVTGTDIEDMNSISNILEEMEKGFDLPTTEAVDEKIAEAITSVYKYKGSVATYDDLPTSGRKSGDVYNVADTGKNYAYNGLSWDDLGGSAVIVVENIVALTTAQCDRLNCGDKVIKLTGNQKHCYTVTYKEANVGMCLTYVDASLVETVSYDYVSEEWVYNSTDSTSLAGGGGAYYHTITMEVLNECSSGDTLITVLQTNNSTPITEEIFKSMFSVGPNGGGYYGLSIPNITYSLQSQDMGYGNIISYNADDDIFYMNRNYTLVSLVDTVTTIPPTRIVPQE